MVYYLQLIPSVFVENINFGFIETILRISIEALFQELGLQLKLEKAHLQTSDADYSLLKSACEQLSLLPTARSLYLKAKHLLFNTITSESETHLQTLSVQSKFGDSAQLERSCRTWHCLTSGFHPGLLSFLLQAASDTLPTAVYNLRRWYVQSVHFV